MSATCGECNESICQTCGECINTSECEWAVYGCFPDRAARLAQVPLERMVEASEMMIGITRQGTETEGDSVMSVARVDRQTVAKMTALQVHEKLMRALQNDRLDANASHDLDYAQDLMEALDEELAVHRARQQWTADGTPEELEEAREHLRRDCGCPHCIGHEPDH